jgi:hypothetical protein
MRRLFSLPVAILAVLVMAGLLIPHLRPDLVEAGSKKADGPIFKYVGATGCKFCHQGKAGARIYEGWLTTEHAKAFEHLAEASRDNDKCLACHTTGFGEPIAAGATAASLQGVQCEACHGPGSEYKKISIMKNRDQATSLGLIAPSEAVCKRCHTANLPEECWAGTDAPPKFKHESAYEKIEHQVPKKSRK